MQESFNVLHKNETRYGGFRKQSMLFSDHESLNSETPSSAKLIPAKEKTRILDRRSAVIPPSPPPPREALMPCWLPCSDAFKK